MKTKNMFLCLLDTKSQKVSILEVLFVEGRFRIRTNPRGKKITAPTIPNPQHWNEKNNNIPSVHTQEELM